MRLLLPALLLVTGAKAQVPATPSIIPLPVEMTLTGGTLSLECPWTVSRATGGLEQLEEEILALHPTSNLNCLVATSIQFRLVSFDTLMPPEWHHLSVRPDGIVITAPSEEGLFRGSRTLIQLLEQGRASASLPCLTITDWPRFPWRGMHLDPCRHFWSVEFTKKYIDLLARYKMNSFHWHLTDDQGWRIEIKKYPKLTEVGAWRSGSQIGPYSRREYDSIPYGGFYTQDDIREVVAYAAARHINVVPEIEMPGHALAALAAYPELGCTGGPYEVNKGWGVFEDVFCAGNDSVFSVLEDVLTEVMDLFPSPYIHIGGDECPKDSWEKCAKCQSRMTAEGLKDEHELQSYFIQRMEKFVNSKGRKIIGWDEILEGGLAPNAAVMSWRGTEGGVAAAKSGHYAVMSPGSHCYFDHYQGDPANEPLAIGGYTTVQKVYSYEPIPAELNAEQAKYILGAQGNIWTEYILTPEHVEYMAVPRMLALSEVLWTPKAKRDEADFIQRLEKEFPRLDALKVNASRSLYQVRIGLKQGEKTGTIDCVLDNPSKSRHIQFKKTGMTHSNEGHEILSFSTEVSGFDPERLTIFPEDETVAIHLSDSDSAIFGSSPYPVTKLDFHFNLATAQKITLSEQPNERYNEGGAFTLVDGITAQEKRVNTEWLGWREGVTITVDLGSVQEISYFGIGALNETHSWIHLPEVVDFFTSEDGIKYTIVGVDVASLVYPGGREPSNTTNGPPQGRKQFSCHGPVKGRFVRLTVQHRGKIPEGYPGAGNPAWMFLDEVEVR